MLSLWRLLSSLLDVAFVDLAGSNSIFDSVVKHN